MKRKIKIFSELFLLLLIVFILGSCMQELPFVPNYDWNDAENMVFIPGGTYVMGDWVADPYFVSYRAGQGINVKDVTPDGTHGMNLTFDAKPAHTVSVGDFYMSRYEVSFEEFDRFCYEIKGYLHFDGFEGDKDYPPKSWGRGRRPAINVSWIDAVKYCNWLSLKEGYQQCYTIYSFVVQCDFSKNGYRLPTEAEWEYAARDLGANNLYAGCNDVQGTKYTAMGVYTDTYIDIRETKGFYMTLRDYAWFNLTSGWSHKDAPSNDNGKSHPVGMKKPNALGLFDMSGNVWEWCWDYYDPNYYQYCVDNSITDNPKGPSESFGSWLNNCHTLRGGSWANYPVFLRTTFRFFSKKQYYTNYSDTTYYYYNYRTGFRLVRTAK